MSSNVLISLTWSLLSPTFFILITVAHGFLNCLKKAPTVKPVLVPLPPAVGALTEVKKVEDIKPQVFEKNEKERLIAEGNVKRNKHDYPTFDDVLSDWETKDDDEGEGGNDKKKEKGQNGKDKESKGKGKSGEKKESEKEGTNKDEKYPQGKRQNEGEERGRRQ